MTSRGPTCTNHSLSTRHLTGWEETVVKHFSFLITSETTAILPWHKFLATLPKVVSEKKKHLSTMCPTLSHSPLKNYPPPPKVPLFFPVFGFSIGGGPGFVFYCWISLKPPRMPPDGRWLHKNSPLSGQLGNPNQRSDKKSQLLQNWARAHPLNATTPKK